MNVVAFLTSSLVSSVSRVMIRGRPPLCTNWNWCVSAEKEGWGLNDRFPLEVKSASDCRGGQGKVGLDNTMLQLYQMPRCSD